MKCGICLSQIKKDSQVFQCIKCNQFTHYKCYLQWVKNKSYTICPYCNYKTEGKIQSTTYIDSPTETSSSETNSNDDYYEYNDEYDIEEQGVMEHLVRYNIIKLWMRVILIFMCSLIMVYFFFSIQYYNLNPINNSTTHH